MQLESFRLNQPLEVVQLDGDSKGRRSTLPVGSCIRILRDSRIVPGCIEIICDGILYSAFEENLRARSHISFGAYS